MERRLMCAPTDLPLLAVPVACAGCRDTQIENAQLKTELRLMTRRYEIMHRIACTKEDHLAELRAESIARQTLGHFEGRAEIPLQYAGSPLEGIPSRQGDPVRPAEPGNGYGGCE